MSVFGALNRLISRLDDGPPQQARSKGDGTFGFQVLRNKSKEVPLEPWFDFIVGINGRQIVGYQHSNRTERKADRLA